MPNATSNFLQGANAANAAGAAAPSGPAAAPPELDDTAILTAVGAPEVNDMSTLAIQLGVEIANVEPEVLKLAKQGLLEMAGSSLKLSPAGERALRYTNLAKM